MSRRRDQGRLSSGHEDADGLHDDGEFASEEDAYEGHAYGEHGYDEQPVDGSDAFDAEGYDLTELAEVGQPDPLATQSRGSRHRQPRQPRQPGAGRAARRLLVLVVALALVAVAGFAALSVIRPMVSGFGGSNDFPGPGTGAVEVVVNPGDTGRSIGATLEGAGVVKSAKAFSDAAANNPAAAGIQPGAYTMRKAMSAADAVAYLVDSKNRSAPRVTIREGLWKSEVFAELSKASGLPVADYEKASSDSAALGLPAAANTNVEGYLFPATYEFAPKATAAEQLRMMVQKAVAELTRLGIAPEQMERTMILASIVEAEGRRDEDRPKIARVIENRLAKQMLLQLDSTVSYGVQKRAITTTNDERAAANDYNTYVRAGLPAGPIGNPGASAIQAAVSPVAGPWIYFVTTNPSTGETKFATTDAEHQANVKEFQAWCSANKGQC